MRHNKGFNHLGRTSGHRKAMLANMASSLIMHKRIETTLAKAKALREYVEPLITKSKEDSTHSRRTVFAYLKQKEAVSELFRTISPKIADRPGGYTRILKIGFRQGDAAEMAMIELVDFNEAAIANQKAVEKKTTTRRSRKKSAAIEKVGTPATEVKQKETKAVKIEKTSKPEKIVEPEKSAEPKETVKPEKSKESKKSVESEKAVKSEKVDEHEKATEPKSNKTE